MITAAHFNVIFDVVFVSHAVCKVCSLTQYILTTTFCVLYAQAEEAKDLSKLMMSKKTQRLYGRMQHGIEGKKAAVRALETKRESIEQSEAPTSAKKATPAKGGKKGAK